jgi:hypothetical protein
MTTQNFIIKKTFFSLFSPTAKWVRPGAYGKVALEKNFTQVGSGLFYEH